MGIRWPSAARYANPCHTSGNTGKDSLFSLFAELEGGRDVAADRPDGDAPERERAQHRSQDGDGGCHVTPGQDQSRAGSQSPQ
jgi:hypothetical protein